VRTRDRVAARFYKSSDRTHITKIRWTKQEREVWAQDIRDSAARMRKHMENGDLNNACAALLHMEGLASTGIFVAEHSDARREFFDMLDHCTAQLSPAKCSHPGCDGNITELVCSVCRSV
jgi:hypothetical protein